MEPQRVVAIRDGLRFSLGLYDRLLALVIWALIALVRHFGGGRSTGEEESAQAILEMRFARGELSTAEFKKMVATLAKAGR